MKNVLIEIKEKDDSEIVSIFVKGKEEYRINHDGFTGDWCLFSEKNHLQEWHLSKESALNAALQRLGILEDASIERAPDRTSA